MEKIGYIEQIIYSHQPSWIYMRSGYIDVWL